VHYCGSMINVRVPHCFSCYGSSARLLKVADNIDNNVTALTGVGKVVRGVDEKVQTVIQRILVTMIRRLRSTIRNRR